MEPSAASHRRVLGPGVTFAKRLIRRAIRWYVGPQLAELHQKVQELQVQLRHETARLHGHLAQLETQRADTQAGLLVQFLELRAEIDRHCGAQAKHLRDLSRHHDQLSLLEVQRADTQAGVQVKSLKVRAEIEPPLRHPG
jgi:hypothetical protein